MRSQKRSFPATSFLFIQCLLLAAIVSQQAQAQKFKVLHTFHGKDGAAPASQLVLDAAGNMYGTTEEGGTGTCPFAGPGCGTVFKLNKNGRLIWSHSFHGKDGWIPAAGVFRDSAGNLFGTTVWGGKKTKACGGSQNNGCGVVFKVDASGRGTVLYKFNGNPDAYESGSLLVEDALANLYGTSMLGGSGGNAGTVFTVDQTGKERVLISFPGPPDQSFPGPGLIRRPNNKLYGVTLGGGSGNAGTVFRTTTIGKQAILYNFIGGSDGGSPASILTADKAGNLYGTTRGGGGSNCSGGDCGTVFKLSPHAGGWTEQTLYTFCQLSGCTDGERPRSGPLVVDNAGNIYGTTYFGGNNRNCNGEGCGLVFKIDPNGNEIVLHNFTVGADGALPSAGLTMDASGVLYGTTFQGGDPHCKLNAVPGCGVVFRITP